MGVDRKIETIHQLNSELGLLSPIIDRAARSEIVEPLPAQEFSIKNIEGCSFDIAWGETSERIAVKLPIQVTELIRIITRAIRLVTSKGPVAVNG